MRPLEPDLPIGWKFILCVTNSSRMRTPATTHHSSVTGLWRGVCRPLRSRERSLCRSHRNSSNNRHCSHECRGAFIGRTGMNIASVDNFTIWTQCAGLAGLAWLAGW